MFYMCVFVCVPYSSKFSSKIKYVNSLAELEELIPMEYVHIPECIIKWVRVYVVNSKH